MKKNLLRHLLLALPLVALPLLRAAAPATPAPTEAVQRWAKYEPEFQAFAAADRANPPVREGILFAGSSIFRQWKTVGEQLAPLPVLHRDFGGSQTPDQLARFDQVVLPYAPRIIVYYCGSNDINAGRAPDAIAANFRSFVQRVHAALPGTRIFYASILRAPQKEERWNLVDEANRLIREFCAGDARLGFIDLNPAVFDAAGRPRLELYRDDRLHYLPPAYVEFARIIKPVLEQAWRELPAPVR